MLHTMILSSFSLFHDLFPCLSLFYGHLLYQCSCSLFHCILLSIVPCSIVHIPLFFVSLSIVPLSIVHCSLFYCSYHCSLVPLFPCSLSIVHCSSYHCSLHVYIARYLWLDPQLGNRTCTPLLSSCYSWVSWWIYSHPCWSLTILEMGHSGLQGHRVIS